MQGIPNFFTPNLHAMRGAMAMLGVEAASYYSTAPLRATLAELVDFDYLCECRTRITVGAVNVCSGRMHYFDNRKERLGVDHVMAPGALPPAFAAVRIEGEPYWDGGIYSNTPIEAVLDDKPRRDPLIFAINVWHQHAPEPDSLQELMARQKDIQFASRADSYILRQKQIHRLRHVIRELTAQIPAAQRDDPKVKELASWGCGTTMHVTHLLAPRVDGEDHTKDIDFSSAGIRARREAGYADTRSMLERAPWTQPAVDPIDGVIEPVGAAPPNPQEPTMDMTLAEAVRVADCAAEPESPAGAHRRVAGRGDRRLRRRRHVRPECRRARAAGVAVTTIAWNGLAFLVAAACVGLMGFAIQRGATSRREPWPRRCASKAPTPKATRSTGWRPTSNACRSASPASSPISSARRSAAASCSPTSRTTCARRWRRCRAIWSCCCCAMAARPCRRAQLSGNGGAPQRAAQPTRRRPVRADPSRSGRGAAAVRGIRTRRAGQDVAQKFALDADRRGVSLQTTCDERCAGLRVHADIGMVERVFENLLDNALRHTPAGGAVTIELGCVTHRARAVRDTGPGIAAARLLTMFDRYERADRSAPGSPGGLGLAIARHIVQLHGGVLSADAERMT